MSPSSHGPELPAGVPRVFEEVGRELLGHAPGHELDPQYFCRKLLDPLTTNEIVLAEAIAIAVGQLVRVKRHVDALAALQLAIEQEQIT